MGSTDAIYNPRLEQESQASEEPKAEGQGEEARGKDAERQEIVLCDGALGRDQVSRAAEVISEMECVQRRK